MTVGTALRRTGAVSGWTPASLPSLWGWWDASQESYADSDPVGTFTDRSGNSRNFTSSGANRPTFKTSIMGGKPVLRFNGSSSYMTYASSMSGDNLLTLWVVFSAAAGADYVLVEHSTNFTSADGRWLCHRAADNKCNISFRNNAGYTTFVTTATVTTTPAALVGTIDGDATTNEVTGYVSSTTSAGTRPYNGDSSSTFTNQPLYLGSRGASSLWLNGDIAEVGITTAVISAGDLSSLMAYLGTKYGITIT